MKKTSEHQIGIKKIIEKNIYLARDHAHLIQHIGSRVSKYGKKGDLRDKWSSAPIQIEENSCGETVLKICDLEVMSDFETPYMKALAMVATGKGGNILNVGFGLGLLANFIEELRATSVGSEHHIIEYNKEVYELALRWRNSLTHNKDSVHIHHGDWRDVLPALREKNIIFDGIIYDAFPLCVEEICRDSVDFLTATLRYKLTRERTGVITFYVDSTDGLSEAFIETLRSFGVGYIGTKKVRVKLPEREIEYWNKPFFIVPVLSDIIYSSQEHLSRR